MENKPLLRIVALSLGSAAIVGLSGTAWVSYKRSNSSPVQLSGIVTDIVSGGPINGADILVECWWSRFPDEVGLRTYKARSDSSGSYALQMDVCKYVVVGVDAPLHKRQRRIARADHVVVADFELGPGDGTSESLFDFVMDREAVGFVLTQMRE